MSVPDDALRKVPSPPPPPQSTTNAALLQVVVQLQGQQVEASRQLNTVRQQLNGRERERKLNTLTLREIEELPRGAAAVTCYRGVGRMFMQESRNSVENSLKSKDKELNEDVNQLTKKSRYLETEVMTAQKSLRDILQEHQR